MTIWSALTWSVNSDYACQQPQDMVANGRKANMIAVSMAQRYLILYKVRIEGSNRAKCLAMEW